MFQLNLVNMSSTYDLARSYADAVKNTAVKRHEGKKTHEEVKKRSNKDLSDKKRVRQVTTSDEEMTHPEGIYF